ncbi:cupin domain-containing protein [Brumimicrobium oceani]|uniref:DUF985 domain-containing protein n=1 Tax=Brumimicrobium oceani TaxID=2100725 RepID=A0A2U2XHE7_9FLAO|nr:cupin domain-containing protein [Brumimicrobium oceani]PWH87219.1 hypothetical protein DIT68_02850 [Brumimicrobium oceani]
MKSKIQDIVERLDLQEHPEGGYFKETHRSVGEITEENLGENYKGSRNYSTTIYFLLTSANFSAFHRIKQDEIWHFYDGSPIRLHVITKDGAYHEHIIGRDFEKGQLPQRIVEGGDWFASEVLENNSYSLAGCTVSPGFSFEDFEMKSKKELVELFPDHEEIIGRLTRY